MIDPPADPGTPTRSAAVHAYETAGLREHVDAVAAEEPMEIRVLPHSGARTSVAITMRTPGHDFELAAGFLFSEGVIADRGALGALEYCAGAPATTRGNIVNVHLAPGVPFDPARFTRNVYTTSSCGICGKTSIDLVRASCDAPPVGEFVLSREFVLELPGKLAARQTVFERTGGLHAAALFDAGGHLLLVREDVGRHNAVDKVVGHRFLAGTLPASNTVLLVSGRASFELVQKAVAAGIPALAAVGAPSSLAVETARAFDLTLIGFLRDGRFNVYSGNRRLRVETGRHPGSGPR